MNTPCYICATALGKNFGIMEPPDGCWYYKLDLHVVGAYRRVGGATGNKLWAGVFTYMDTGTYEKKWDEGAALFPMTPR